MAQAALGAADFGPIGQATNAGLRLILPTRINSLRGKKRADSGECTYAQVLDREKDAQSGRWRRRTACSCQVLKTLFDSELFEFAQSYTALARIH